MDIERENWEEYCVWLDGGVAALEALELERANSLLIQIANDEQEQYNEACC